MDHLFNIKMTMYYICVYYYLVAFIGVSHGVPHPYCLKPLNRKDCGMKTTPVFSYYKPGSRCEIEYWRGCPTWNKFDSEYSCSSLCIFRLGDEVEVQKVEVQEVQEKTHNEIKQDNSESDSDSYSYGDVSYELTCEGILDEDDCGAEAQTVYSFDADTNTCTQKTWYGCESGAGNKFPDEPTCINYCVTVDIKEWEEGIEDLDEEDIDEMQNIIDELLIPNKDMYAVYTTKSTPETSESTTKTSESTTETIGSTTKTIESTTETIESTTKTIESTPKTIESTTKTIESTTTTPLTPTKTTTEISNNDDESFYIESNSMIGRIR